MSGKRDRREISETRDCREISGKDTLTGKQWAVCALAVVCALAGVIVQNVPGMRFSGRLFLGLALIFGVWLLLEQWARTDPRGVVCQRILSRLLAAVLLVLCLLEAAVIRQGRENWAALPADAVIVLGAGVNGSTPSLALQTRIDAAAAYLNAHPGIPAVLSGGKGSGEDITEAACMYAALTARGIPAERLLKEEQSASTAENLAYSKALLEDWGLDTETAEIAVVTNDFHILRMQLLAGRQNLRTIGIRAPLPWWWLTVNYYLREAFALVKSLLLDWPVPAA